MNPKPFHIGTRVRPVDGDIQKGTYRVLWARLDVVYIEFADFASETKDCLVHADDGSPLGEWVPIKFDGEAVFHADITGLAAISVHDANRIIRGEVEQ